MITMRYTLPSLLLAAALSFLNEVESFSPPVSRFRISVASSSAYATVCRKTARGIATDATAENEKRTEVAIVSTCTWYGGFVFFLRKSGDCLYGKRILNSNPPHCFFFLTGKGGLGKTSRASKERNARNGNTSHGVEERRW